MTWNYNGIKSLVLLWTAHMPMFGEQSGLSMLVWRCCILQWHMTQSRVCTAAIRLPQKGDQTKGKTNAGNLWSHLVGWFWIFSWHNMTSERIEPKPKGANAVVSQLYSYIKAFGTKLLLFQRQLTQTQPNTTHFPSLQENMTSFSENNICSQMRRYSENISSLNEEF